MNRASPVELRKSLDVANFLAKHGIGFVCMPTMGGQDREELLRQMNERLSEMERIAEGAQP